MSSNRSLSSLIDGLVNEAAQAPRLFSDLAKIETYIAESYKTRALIELLQNADDAKAKEFIIEAAGCGLVIANDGRSFTIADVEALCRSGASNKHRGDGTIGYRGIGFKSVVNLAERVWVFSAEHQFLFDRDKTRSLLDVSHEVPLIRIPHLVTPDDITRLELGSWTNKYRTVFFFESLETRLLDEEIKAFDSGCLLFLNHLERIVLRVTSDNREYIRLSRVANQRRYIELAGSGNTTWEILAEKPDDIARVALKIDEDHIVPASPDQATIHSFTPTTEYTGAPVKFNGNFTTDPSRKTVDLDSTSTCEFLRSCSILCEAVRSALERHTERPGLFGALSSQQPSEGRLRQLFWKTMSSILAQTEIDFPGGVRGPISSIRLRPDWLNHDDYALLCAQRWPYIDRSLLVKYPELEVFLGGIGASRLTLDEALHCVTDATLSIRGRAELFARCVVQFRYDLAGDRLRWLRNLPLFPTLDDVIAAERWDDSAEIDPGFLRHVAEVVESSDVTFVLKRLGCWTPTIPASPTARNSPYLPTNRPPQNSPAIAKWRSAERNALEFINAMDTVLAVSDVSEANLGHDLEVTMKSGKRKLVEVKSVTSFNEPFRLTSNEYATASNAGADYIMAIVVNGNQFDIKFIRDPVATLSFERRCERWSWQCSDYASAVSEPEEAFPIGRNKG